jgi:hypothetical protein
MNDLEQRIRDALTQRAEATPVAERRWDEGTLLEDAPAGPGAGRLDGSRPLGRRQMVLGFATVLAAIATLAVGFGAGDWFGNDPEVSVADQPAGAGYGANCSGYTDHLPAEEADGLRFLPTWLPDGQKITHAGARANLLARETCSRMPTALVMIDGVEGDPSRIERAAVLKGPAAGAYRAVSGPGRERVPVRGVLGVLVRPVMTPGEAPTPTARNRDLHWTEPDGSSWSLTSTGLSEDELIRLAEGLVLNGTPDGPPAAAPDPPAGFEVVWQLPQRPGPLPEKEPLWVAPPGSAGGVRLTVTRDAVAHPAIDGVVGGNPEDIRLLQVRGHTAVRNRRFLLWDEAPGVRVQLHGNAVKDTDTLVRIAESLVPVPADDPRIDKP